MISQERISDGVIKLQERLRSGVLEGMRDKYGSLNGTSKVSGYVCKIHGDDDEDESLRGTVDVQEYAYDADEYNGEAVGFHEGVLLSSIQGNKGYKIVPCLFSEVVIVQDPCSLQWYVQMYSHASVIDMKAHDEVRVEVTEYEDFSETEDGLSKDYDELEETGRSSRSVYKAESIETEVKDGDDVFREETTATRRVIEVGGTRIVVEGQKVRVETDGDVSVECKGCEVKAEKAKIDGGEVTITGGTLKTKGQSNTDMNGPFNAIKACPFSGVPHCGGIVSGT